jgi:cyclic pyranopterin phosphate synthase
VSREAKGGAGGLTHLDAQGRARMVDVGEKPVTRRECVARGEVRLAPATVEAIAAGRTPKGDVLALVRAAGVQAAKRTHEWIPLAHPLPLDLVEVDVVLDAEAGRARIEARVAAHARTGVEMEALEAVRLVRKRGGRSGVWTRPGEVLPDA